MSSSHQQEAPTIQSPEAQQQSFSDSDRSAPSHPTLSPEAMQGSPANTQQQQQQPHHHSSRRDFAKMRRPSSPNASSAPITQASGAYTGGVVNRHPNSEAVHQEIDSGASAGANTGNNTAAADQGAGGPGSGAINELIAFRVGVSEDRNTKCRRTMEDSHAFVYDFGGVKVCLLPFPIPLPASSSSSSSSFA